MSTALLKPTVSICPKKLYKQWRSIYHSVERQQVVPTATYVTDLVSRKRKFFFLLISLLIIQSYTQTTIKESMFEVYGSKDTATCRGVWDTICSSVMGTAPEIACVVCYKLATCIAFTTDSRLTVRSVMKGSWIAFWLSRPGAVLFASKALNQNSLGILCNHLSVKDFTARATEKQLTDNPWQNVGTEFAISMYG